MEPATSVRPRPRVVKQSVLIGAEAVGAFPLPGGSQHMIREDLSQHTFGAKVREELDRFLDAPLGRMRGETIGGTLRQEYIFVTLCSLIGSLMTYPAVSSLLDGHIAHGIGGLLVAASFSALLPFTYASYLRDTGRMKPGSIWSKLVPRDTLEMCGIHRNGKP